MKLRSVVLAAFVVLTVPLAAIADPVTITPGNYAAVFQFSLTPAGGMFIAQTDSTIETLSDGTTQTADPELFLFDSNWDPVVMNDDNPADPSGNHDALVFDTSTEAAPGTYYLMVTLFNAFPLDQNGNPMFDVTSNDCSQASECGPASGDANVPFQGNFGTDIGGPDGQGATATFNLSATFNGSDIEGTPTALPTPEPASLFLLGTGAFGLVAKFRRRANAA